MNRNTVNHKKRMLAGLPYIADMGGLAQERMQCKRKIWEFNNLHPDNASRIPELVRGIFGSAGEGAYIEAPFHCDYGTNITVGKNFFANYNLTILDVAPVVIGDNVMIAPNVSIYTAGHPVHPDSRNSGYEYGMPITIGNNVWIGGSVTILPGVHIGDNCVIGGGSVVTKDIESDTIVAGNPAHVIRKITSEDRDYYFKNRKFDVMDY
ncbi:sugar O-acetyltransferase [Alloscardovia theropitheci]|uniref:Acetyltransferase n=1 Tax=Alloscardovia theropitheci TaxID=2496842 RepID=A0A4R0QWP1_9BIFI|nr:sugar O-acetyltransferase [Alloscardovia theropitheci]TCD54857.1 sugar O-acetyltransferase [Alloscardovia theropitheci]